ncbi:MAG: IS1 family transposase, partial [Paludibacteraceae bacterium]|nr:IS1 family transposase [Paludibacteraceae bacterium]
MSKKRKERYPQCVFLEVIRWGKQAGRQRFKCKNCNSSFTLRRKDISKSNRFVWFKWWITGKQTLKQISELSGYSTRQLSRWFDEYLDDYPTWKIKCGNKVNLLIDGTWFSNKICLVVYRD